jgi:hypothetical protein
MKRKTFFRRNPTTIETVEVFNEDGDSLKVEVKFEYWHDPGMWTMPNGDPGYPEDSGYNIISVYLASGEPLPDWVTDDLVQEALDAAIESGKIEFD